MKTILSIPRKRWLTAVSFAICAAFVGITTTWASSAYFTQENKVQIKDVTNGFQVLSTEVKGQELWLVLKNTSNKRINGFEIIATDPKSQTTTTFQRDFAYFGTVLLPGTTTETRISISDFPIDQNQSVEFSVSILAVLFDDQTSIGDPKAIKELVDRRLGVRTQLKKIITEFDNFLQSSTAPTTVTLNSLKFKIQALPTEAEPTLSHFAGGLHNGKEMAIQAIEDIESKQATDEKLNLQSAMEETKKELQAILNRLQ